MAACSGSLQHIFDKPLPETPSLLQSLSSSQPSWHQLHPSIDQSSFTELFGELHFKDNNPSHTLTGSSNLPDSSFTGSLKNSFPLGGGASQIGDCFQLCTEGLGSESSADVEDLMNSDMPADLKHEEEKTLTTQGIWKQNHGEFRRSSSRHSGGGGFPPPISCIGRTGKPWVWFKSYRQDGRFLLTEVRIPTQEILHASREDGRLKLQFVQPDDDEIIEDEEEEEDEEAEHFMQLDGGEQIPDQNGRSSGYKEHSQQQV